MNHFKNFVLSIFILFFSSSIVFADNTEEMITSKAKALLKTMTLKEKIGQKIMLDFRYWCDTQSQNGSACTQDFTAMNNSVQQVVSSNHIGGVILFANNLKDISQITTLTNSFQQVMFASHNPGLLIGTDQEGGIVARLPRDVSVSFPGNIAITAASLGNPDKNYSAKVGKIIGKDLKAVGINTDFAPDVDVNVNPLNPVINVRSFSDDPKIVAKLGFELSRAIQNEGVAATLKHFPGHGDTVTDSHIGLPVVDHTIDQAWKIDLFPFKKIIEKNSPDLIMTAHIQYPALDNSQIYAGKSGAMITTPATLSRKIQRDLLRNQLGYQGVVVTDALNMGAISQNFDPIDATIKAFQAGDDIALMPVSVTQSQDINLVADMITKIETAVSNGTISEKEIDESVLRILKLKMKLGLLDPDSKPLSEKISKAQQVIANQKHHDFESHLTDDAVTLVKNDNLIPIKVLPNMRIHILTPWLEQGAGIAMEIQTLQTMKVLRQDLLVSFARMSDTDFSSEQKAIDNADIIIVGNSAAQSLPLSGSIKLKITNFFHQSQGSLVFPDLLAGDGETSQNNSRHTFFTNTILPDQFAFNLLQYATMQHKKTIFISLLAPYDLPNYISVANAMLAGYDYYGYLSVDATHGYFRGPSMQALTRIIFGVSHARGKLAINIPDPNNPNNIVYPRGYGLLD